jgi:RNA polymerase I-specific transcription initiation factor RRN7
MESSEQCPTCGTQSWEDNGDGNDRCRECGYIRPRLSNAADEDEFGGVGTTTRRKKDKRKKQSLYFKGAERRKFWILSHQFILRKQLRWLIDEKNMPTELEELVRALWEQRLNALAPIMGENEGMTTFSTTEWFGESENEASGPGPQPIPLSTMPRLQDTLVLCYLGMYILRIPIFLGDIVTWVQNDELVYTRALDILPAEMRERMDPMGANEARVYRRPLDVTRFQARVHRLIMGYQMGLGMEIPPINLPLYLYRFVQDLALPIEIYLAVKKLASLLDYTFQYPITTNKNDLRRLPDRSLASLVVVAVKVLYPFDDRKRTPASGTEPTAAVMDWAKWVKGWKALKQKTRRKFAYEDGVKTTENDVLYMDNAQLDQYMDWFQENLQETRGFLGEETENTFLDRMLEMFPVETKKDATESKELPVDNNLRKISMLQHTQSNLIIRNPEKETEDEDPQITSRPGMWYRRYRQTSEIPEGNMKEFLSAVAELVGMDLDYLSVLVFAAERKVETWGVAERKRLKSQGIQIRGRGRGRGRVRGKTN